MSVLELAVERLSNSVLGYYHLWTYLDAGARRVLARKPTHEVHTCLDFYNRLFKGEIKHGDRVKLNEFFVSEWIPRAAGGVAYLVHNHRLPLEEYEVLHKSNFARSSYLQRGNVVPPFGSSRLPIEKTKRIALSAVSAREYHADLGIVLSVSDSVYSEFLTKQFQNFAVEASLEGYIETYDTPDNFPQLSQDPSVGDFLTSSTPKYVLRIDSPLQIRFRTHDTHPRLNAWVIRRMNHEQYGLGYDYLHMPVENDAEEFQMVRKIINDVSLFLDFEAVRNDFAESTRSFLGSFENMREENSQVGRITEFECLTEFDGRSLVGEPIIPLRVDPRANSSTVAAVDKSLSELRSLETQASTPPYHRHDLTTSALSLRQKVAVDCRCGKVSVAFQFDFGEELPLEDGHVRYPSHDVWICPKCGNKLNISELRKEMERRAGSAIIS